MALIKWLKSDSGLCKTIEKFTEAFDKSNEGRYSNEINISMLL